MGINSEIDITNCQTEIAKNRCELDWYGTSVFDNKYKTGWVSPSGKFFGCDYTMHSLQAKYLHKSSEEQLENEGKIIVIRPSQPINVGHIERDVSVLKSIYQMGFDDTLAKMQSF